MTNKIIQQIEKQYLKAEIPQFRVGDTVDVHTRIIEGDKERIQVFAGVVIGRRGDACCCQPLQNVSTNISPYVSGTTSSPSV